MDVDTGRRWQHECRTDLYVGEIHKITQPLERARLPSLAAYFRTHARLMQYAEFRERGSPTSAPPAEQVRVGSGNIKSGIKPFKHRLTSPGMRWSRPAAERMLILRAAVLSGTFDELWTIAKS